MERARPRRGGPESSAANTQDAARLGFPYTERHQVNQAWRTALRATRTWRVGSGHALPTTKAAWFGGGLAGMSNPTQPLFN